MLVWAWKCLEYAGCSRPANSDYSAASSNADSAWARALETDIALVGGPTNGAKKESPARAGHPPPCKAKATMRRPGAAVAVCALPSDGIGTIGAAARPNATGSPSSENAPRRENIFDLIFSIMSASKCSSNGWKAYEMRPPAKETVIGGDSVT